ncbi:MAG: hypothetical protein ABSF98_27185 [Bryobacteraceae bacterium]|jgi:hypothetical protein
MFIQAGFFHFVDYRSDPISALDAEIRAAGNVANSLIVLPEHSISEGRTEPSQRNRARSSETGSFQSSRSAQRETESPSSLECSIAQPPENVHSVLRT